MKKLGVVLTGALIALMCAGCDLNKEEEKPPVASDYRVTYSGAGTYSGNPITDLKLGSSSITIGSEKIAKVKTSGGGSTKLSGISTGKWDYVYVNGVKWGIVVHQIVGGSTIYIGKTGAGAGKLALSVWSVQADITDIPDQNVPAFTGSYSKTQE